MFIGQKKKEGWDKNTIDMYLQCNIRFCQFLVSENMNSFDSLTPEAIKQFNLSDRHQTMEAKNAYNSRIRKFLIHLELKNAVQGGLHFALCNQAAGSERIVETFSEEDCKRIQEYCERASTPLGLRMPPCSGLGWKWDSGPATLCLCGYLILIGNQSPSGSSRKRRGGSTAIR